MIDIEMMKHLETYCSHEGRALSLGLSKRYIFDLMRGKNIPKTKKAKDRMKEGFNTRLDGLIELATKCKKSLD